MNRDFLDLLHALSGAEARFMVVGAYAMAVHSRPRATGDLDIWVEATSENATKVYGALASFGAPLDQLEIDDLATEGVIFQIGRPPRRIDLLTSISGVAFSEAWPRCVAARFGDRKFPVIGLEDLVVNKRAAGRPKDLLDAELLEEVIRQRAERGL